MPNETDKTAHKPELARALRQALRIFRRRQEAEKSEFAAEFDRLSQGKEPELKLFLTIKLAAEAFWLLPLLC